MENQNSLSGYQYKPTAPSPQDTYVLLLYVLEKLIPGQRVTLGMQELEDFVLEANKEHRGVRVLVPIKKDIKTGDVVFGANGEAEPVMSENMIIYSAVVPQKAVEPTEPTAAPTGPQLVM